MSTLHVPLKPFSAGLSDHIVGLTMERDEKLAQLNSARREGEVGEATWEHLCEVAYAKWKDGVQVACADVMASAEKSLKLMVNLHQAIRETQGNLAAMYGSVPVEVPEMPEV